MSLVKRTGLWPEVNRLFDADWMRNQWPDVSWTPAVNVAESEKEYDIELAAPGIKKDEFKVDVKDGMLTISCETKSEEEEKKKNYTRREFSSKSFARTFGIPENVDAKNVTAKYEDGVLRVSLKKSAKAIPAGRSVNIL